jgi:electron transport complex protein RnfC
MDSAPSNPTGGSASALTYSLKFKHRLWPFHGGVHVPDEKALSSESPIETIPLPRRLIVPLCQHIGAPARPCVRVGERVGKGQPIGEPEGLVSAAVHAPSSGTVVAIGELPIPHPSGLAAPCIAIDTDGADAWAELPPPIADYLEADPALLLERIRGAGIVGLGGACFPTSVKLAPAPGRRPKTLILNGAECEPYITCDDRLMRERAPRILAGAAIMGRLVGAERVLIGIEDNKPEAVAAMVQALGASPLADTAAVVPIPTLYPSGGERQLIRILTGLEVPSSGIPAQIGVLCQNVATAAAVADAVIEGRPLISRVVTVTGRAIGSPRNLEVPIGTPAAELLAHCGGLRETPRKLLCGGPMMGFELNDTQVPIAKGTNCLLALSAAESPDPGPALACIRCGRCAEVCPASLLPQQLYWYARAKDLEHVQDYHLFDCIECGCCAQVCPSRIPLVHYYRFAKNQVWAREEERRKADQARERHQARQARLERQELERKAKLRKKKEDLETAPAAGSGATQGPAPAAAAADGAESKRAAIEAARQRAAAKRAAAQTAAPPEPAPQGGSDGAAPPAAPAGEAPAPQRPDQVEETH